MCRLAALSIHPDDDGRLPLRRIVRTLLDGMHFGGPHAAGAAWSDDGDVWTQKRTGSPRQFTPDLPARPRSVLLHSRYATQGDPADAANNHPVQAGHTILCHNGVLTRDDDTIAALGYERPAGCDVDTFALAAAVDAHPGRPEHAFAALGAGSNAAAAWLDLGTPAEVHLARWWGRPLAVAVTSRGSLIAASTPDLLRVALAGVAIYSPPRALAEGTYLRVVRGTVRERRPLPSGTDQAATLARTPVGAR